MLARLQKGLEHLYRIDTRVDVGDFVIDAQTRDRIGVARRPREQLLLTEVDGDLEIGLFIDEDALDNLTRRDPSEGLDDHNLPDFLLAVEGVSHFVYLVWRARADQPVSALELELQAEVDKYVTCLLTGESRGDEGEATGASRSSALRRRLFQEFHFLDDLDNEERQRYRAANSNAAAYSASLERRFVRPGRIADMLGELRRFYRMSLGAKLDFIKSAA